MKQKKNFIVSFMCAVFVLMLFLVSNPYISDYSGIEMMTQHSEEMPDSQICAPSIGDTANSGEFCLEMAAKPTASYIQRAKNDIGKSIVAFVSVLLVVDLSLWMAKRAFLSYLQLHLFFWPRFLFDLFARQKKDGKKKQWYQRQAQAFSCV